MVTRTVGLVCLVLVVLQPARTDAFDFGELRELARSLGSQPFRQPTNRIPASLLSLNYVQYQSIEFRREKALWAGAGLPFEVEFFLPGSPRKDLVVIHEVSEGAPRRVAFSPDAFNVGTNKVDLAPDLNYAGFRILHGRQNMEEFASFVGASYFRMVGRGQPFGASARGLALNTVTLNREEFPAFREFWLRKPGPQDPAITVWALLESESVTGAFEFVITPGVATVARIRAALFPRREIRQFGIAPLTSMFYYDENSHPSFRDFRPEVHDSDLLLMQTGAGEFLARPLESGKMMRLNAYQDAQPKGFGLIQRDRDFEHYQDVKARFQDRPSVWVKPLGNWGEGTIQVVQLPTDIEYTDNVVAFWTPKDPPKPGSPIDVAYETHWLTNEITPRSLGYARATRIGTVPVPEHPERPNLRFVVDFAGPSMEALTAREQIHAEVHHGEGVKLVGDTVLKNELNGTWRLVMEFTNPSKAVDLRATLRRQGKAVTETWVFTWQP